MFTCFHLIPGQNGQSLYPFSDQKDPKTISFGAAHTYMAYIRQYPHQEFQEYTPSPPCPDNFHFAHHLPLIVFKLKRKIQRK